MAKAPVKALTKNQVYAAIAEATQLHKKQVASVFDSLAEEIKKSLGKKGPGIFTIPGLVKIKRKDRPARPARMVRNPATGEMIQAAARPASLTVGVRALKNLKSMV